MVEGGGEGFICGRERR